MNNFCDTIKTSSVTLAGCTLYLNVAGVQFNTMCNLDRFKLIICQCVPCNAGTAQVILSDGIVDVPVQVETGNYLRADQLKCRKCYPMIFGNNPVHVSLLCGVPHTGFAAPSPADSVSTPEVQSVKKA